MNKNDWLCIWLLLKDTYYKDKKRVISMIVLAFIEVFHVYIGIFLLGNLVDLFSKGYSFERVVTIVAAAFLFEYLCTFIQKEAQKYYDTKLDYTKDIETKYMNEKAMEFDYEYLEEPEVADLRYRSFGKSYYGITGWCLMTTKSLIKGFFSIVITGIVVSPMIIQNVNEDSFISSRICAIILLGCVLLFTFLNYKAGIYYTRKAKEEINRVENLYNRKQYYLEKFSDIEFQKDIRISSLQDTVLYDVNRMFDGLKEVEYEHGACFIKREHVGGVLVGLNCALVYLYTGISAFMGSMTVGSALILASSILQFSTQMVHLGAAFGNIKSAAMFAKDYLDFMGLKDKNSSCEIRDVNSIKKIEFDHVSFKYPDEQEYVLMDVCLTIDTDETIAIVGQNGSGKTTLIKLLCGLYQDYEGQIKVDGVDLKKLNKEEYWKRLSIVFQDYNILDFSIRENFNEGESDKNIFTALKKSGLEIDSLDYKVGKNVYSDGINFSGGERQKMAIARSILKNACAVIMDEPTAALDPIAENEIYRGFSNLINGRGGIYISHRLSSCQFCQKIIVFNGGKVVQQ